MMRSRGLGLVLLGLSLAWACGPSEDRGPVKRVYLDDDMPVAGAPGNAAGAPSGVAGEAGAAAVPEPDPPPEPSVTAMMPVSGPYGSEIRIQGEGLGSAARAGVSILLGEDEAGELTPASDVEVVSWNENEIRFRFPFPFEGRVLVRTPQGEAVAGEFEPTWVPGPAFESVADVTSIAAVASAAGSLSVVLDTGPPSLVTFDGSDWSSGAIAGNNLRSDSIRLFVDGQTLSAFALSTATTPEIIALDPNALFAQTGSGVDVTADYRVAGGLDGATVWSRSGNNWSRARPTAGTWAAEPELIVDPYPNAPHHAAAATSSGALYVGWAEEAGTTLDDKGIAKHRFVAAGATAFTTSTAVTGIEMDDAISSILMFDRGAGVLTQYCGTDEDPLGVTGNDKLCYVSLLPGGPKATLKESATLRYGFGAASQVLSYCSSSLGVRVVPSVGAGGKTGATLDALAGDVVAWPCPNVLAVEVDADGAPLLLLELDGQLYSPRPRVP